MSFGFSFNWCWNDKDWNKIGCNDTKFAVAITVEIITIIAVVLSSRLCMCVFVWKLGLHGFIHSVCVCVADEGVWRVLLHAYVCVLKSCWVCQADKHCWSSAGSLLNRLPPIENIPPNICWQTDFNKTTSLVYARVSVHVRVFVCVQNRLTPLSTVLCSHCEVWEGGSYFHYWILFFSFTSFGFFQVQ